YTTLETTYDEELTQLVEDDNVELREEQDPNDESELLKEAPITADIIFNHNDDSIRIMTNFERQEYLDLIALIKPELAKHKAIHIETIMVIMILFLIYVVH